MNTAAELTLAERTLEDFLDQSKPLAPRCLVRVNTEEDTEQLLFFRYGGDLAQEFEATVRQLILAEKAEFLPARDIPLIKKADPRIFSMIRKSLVIFSKLKGSTGELSVIDAYGPTVPLGTGDDFFQAAHSSGQMYYLRVSWLVFKRPNH